jgi:hypothetical protein
MPDDPWLEAKGLRSGYGGKPVDQEDVFREADALARKMAVS